MPGPLGCLTVAVLLAGSTGAAGHARETTVQDDALLLHRPESQVRQVTKQLAELGADRVRITAGWSALAPSPRSKRMPKGDFKEDDSGTYPQVPVTEQPVVVPENGAQGA